MEESKQQKAEREKTEGANLTEEDKKRQRELVKAEKLAKKEAAAAKKINKGDEPKELLVNQDKQKPVVTQQIENTSQKEESKQEKAAREKAQGANLTEEEKKRLREQVKAEK